MSRYWLRLTVLIAAFAGCSRGHQVVAWVEETADAADGPLVDLGTDLAPETPRFELRSSGTTERLNGVWGPNDGSGVFYVVGDHGLLLRLPANGEPSAIETSTPNNLMGVWGRGPTEIFAVGEFGVLYGCDGTTVTESHNPGVASGAGARSLSAIWGSTTGPELVTVGSVDGFAFHYDGATWTAHETGGVPLHGVWGHAADDVYAVGGAGFPAPIRIVAFDGASWTPMTVPDLPSRVLHAAWSPSPSEMMAVGDTATVLRYGGASWTRDTLNAAYDAHGVWGSSPDDLWVAAGGGHVLHYDGVEWTVIDTGAGFGLRGVWGDATRVVVVGNAGTILQLTR